ncbi:MAG: hypothetical protein N3B18_00230 [Desulfobacterota bacterium]|nr:hypothetical protein [Thermodesulfobacteriota bacterium]
MAGIIEHQQGILHSQLVEKLQQVKQEHMNVYQQYAGAALEQQNIREKHIVPETHTPRDVRIDTEKKKRLSEAARRKRKGAGKPKEEEGKGSSGSLLDIVA